MGFPLGRNWVIDAADSRYGISTTATISTVTPGDGEIVRTVDVKSDPDVVGLTLGAMVPTNQQFAYMAHANCVCSIALFVTHSSASQMRGLASIGTHQVGDVEG